MPKQNMTVFIKNAVKIAKHGIEVYNFFISADLGFTSNIFSVSLMFYIKWRYDLYASISANPAPKQ